MTNLVSTVEQAHSLLIDLGLIVEHDETNEKYVEGKALLDAMGLKYKDDTHRKVINRVIGDNLFEEGSDYVVIHPSEIHRDISVPMGKWGNRAKAYVFTPMSAAKAVLSAHTKKGDEARTKMIERDITKTVALEAVVESTSHGEAVEAAQLGLEGKIHELMSMVRPSQRLQRILDKGESLDEAINNIIKASANNPKASYQDRVRFANSLRHALTQVGEATLTKMIKDKPTLISNFLVQREAADNAILKYEKRLARQQHSLLESKQQQK